MTLHDSGDHRESEPRAFAGGLGREKGIEYLIDDRRWDPRTAVDHRNAQIRSDLKPGIGRTRVGVDRDILGENLDDTAIRHGVAAIDAKVDQHLIELRGVDAMPD